MSTTTCTSPVGQRDTNNGCCDCSLEKVLIKELENSFHDKNTSYPESLETMKIRLLKRVADELKLPIVDDLFLVDGSEKSLSQRIVLSRETSRNLDNTWNRIMINRGSDNIKISAKDKNVRDDVLSNVYVEKSTLYKFINILLRKDSMETNENILLLKSNLINNLLAVDGFGGISVRDYKHYINNLNDRLPERNKKHILAVRAMYTYFTKSITNSSSSGGGGSSISINKNSDNFYNVNGTETTCLIFLTLLNLYKDRVGSRLEDCAKLILDRLEKFVLNFMDLINYGRKYKKIRIDNGNNNSNNNDSDIKRKYRKLKKIYCNYIADEEMLDWIAFEKINGENFILLQQHLEQLQQQQ